MTQFTKKNQQRILKLIPIFSSAISVIMLSFFIFKAIQTITLPTTGKARSFKVKNFQTSPDHYLQSNIYPIGTFKVDPLKAKKLRTYTDPNHKFSFDYSAMLNLNKRTKKDCKTKFCEKLSKFYKTIKIDSLFISTANNPDSSEIIFDRGFDKSKHIAPQKAKIEDQTFYYIISKDGFIKAITKEYKYRNDMIWIKTSTLVEKPGRNYYISFYFGESYNRIPKNKMKVLNKIFKTFKF